MSTASERVDPVVRLFLDALAVALAESLMRELALHSIPQRAFGVYQMGEV